MDLWKSFSRFGKQKADAALWFPRGYAQGPRRIVSLDDFSNLFQWSQYQGLSLAKHQGLNLAKQYSPGRIRISGNEISRDGAYGDLFLQHL